MVLIDTIAAWVACATLTMSVVYHVVRTVPSMETSFLLLDKTLVITCVCAFAFSEGSTHTNAYANSDIRTIADIPLCACILVAVIVAFSMSNPPNVLRKVDCTLASVTFEIVDDAYANCSSSGLLPVVLIFILTVPSLNNSLPSDVVVASVIGCVSSTFLVIGGQVVIFAERVLCRVTRKLLNIYDSTSKKDIMRLDAHAVWHIASACAILVSINIRENTTRAYSYAC